MPISNNESGIKPGTVAHFAAASAPVGWVKANGAAVSRATYAALFLAIGTTYGAGDGSTTFNLPDLRGEFIRGFDDARGVDSGRAIGSAQGGCFQDHSHGYEQAVSGGTVAGSRVLANNGALAGYGTTLTANTGTFGNETRPRNMAMLACIKY